MLAIFLLLILMNEQCYAVKQALGKVSAELLDTQVNPAVWEISGHLVLKRKEDYEGASEENAWRLLAEVSLSEERFKKVSGLIFEAIVSGGDNGKANLLKEQDVKPQYPGEVDATNKSSGPAMVTGSK